MSQVIQIDRHSRLTFQRDSKQFQPSDVIQKSQLNRPNRDCLKVKKKLTSKNYEINCALFFRHFEKLVLENVL